MKIDDSGTPHCRECDRPTDIKIRFENPGVVQNGSLALCGTHALQLAQYLIAAAAKE